MKKVTIKADDYVGRLGKDTYELYTDLAKNGPKIPDYVGPIIKGVDVGKQRYTDEYPTYPLIDLAKDVSEQDIQFKTFWCRFYAYDKHEADCPVYFFIHGGGFVKGKLPKLNNIGRYLAYHGKACAVHVEYSLSPEAAYPQALNECYEAITYFHDHAKEFGFNPNKIVIIGESAGANFTAALPLMDQTNHYIALDVMVYPVVDCSDDQMNDFDEKLFGTEFTEMEYKQLYTNSHKAGLCDRYIQGNGDVKDELISPYYSKKLAVYPKSIVMTAEFDFLTFESQRFAEKLAEAGVEVDLVSFPGTFHAFFTRLGVIKQSELAIDYITKTAEEYFNKESR